MKVSKPKRNAGLPLISSMDPLEEERFKKRHSKLITELLKELHFDRDEVESLLLIFHTLRKILAPNDTGIKKPDVLDLLHSGLDMTEVINSERILNAIDKTLGKHVEMRFWVKMFSLFLRGTFDEKVFHCFQVYDDRCTGFITREKMVKLLKGSIITGGDDDADELTNDLVGILCSKLDVDRDGKIDYKDFYTSVRNQPLLMESMGQCLPSREAVLTFLTTFTPNIGKL